MLQSPGPGPPALDPKRSGTLQSQKEGEGASPTQATRRGLCSSCREKIYSHQETGEVTEKKSSAALGDDSACSTHYGLAPGQARLLQVQKSLPRDRLRVWGWAGVRGASEDQDPHGPLELSPRPWGEC